MSRYDFPEARGLILSNVWMDSNLTSCHFWSILLLALSKMLKMINEDKSGFEYPNWQHLKNYCRPKNLINVLLWTVEKRSFGHLKRVWWYSLVMEWTQSHLDFVMKCAFIFRIKSGHMFWLMPLNTLPLCGISSSRITTVQITFIFICQTHLVFGKCVCTCIRKHSYGITDIPRWMLIHRVTQWEYMLSLFI